MTEALSSWVLANPKSTFKEYVAPATASVETVWDIVALIARATMGSGVVALIIGSLLNVFVVCGTPVCHWPASAPRVYVFTDCVQPKVLLSENAQPVPHQKFKYVAAVLPAGNRSKVGLSTGITAAFAVAANAVRPTAQTIAELKNLRIFIRIIPQCDQKRRAPQRNNSQ
ncbi:MAG: hypothetical protein WCF81_01845 [Roseiarcus sp.]